MRERHPMACNGSMTPDDLLTRFHTQIRLADKDAAPGFVVEHDGPVHRTYPADAGAPGAMVECPQGLGEDPAAAISPPKQARRLPKPLDQQTVHRLLDAPDTTPTATLPPVVTTTSDWAWSTRTSP